MQAIETVFDPLGEDDCEMLEMLELFYGTGEEDSE